VKYDFGYADQSPYGSMRRLLAASGAGGIVLDLGCGAAALAEPLRDDGFEYVGCDIAREYVDHLTQRGFEAHVVDLTDQRLTERIGEVLGGRRTAAITALDVIEHLTQPSVAMTAIGEGARQTGALVGLSIPNVAHADLAAKLVAGRWDVLSAGLLDETHVSLFTEQRLTAMTSECGLVECDRQDFVLVDSDQAYPTEHPLLARGTPIGAALRELRRRAAGCADVNQFVRLYRPAAPRSVTVASKRATSDRTDERPSFVPTAVAVLVDQAGPGLADLAACLDAQTDLDLAVTWWVPERLEQAFHDRLVDASTRTMQCIPEGESVVGDVPPDSTYLVILPERTTLMCNWLESARAAIRAHPGHLVVAAGGRQRVERIGDAYVGASAVISAGVGWAGVFWPIAAVGCDRLLAEASAGTGPERLLREAAYLCGRADIDEITNVERVPLDERVPKGALDITLRTRLEPVNDVFDSGADLAGGDGVPRPAAALAQHVRDLEAANRAMTARIDALERSHWWRLTALPRGAVALVRRRRQRTKGTTDDQIG
jgi:Methyltransferase domain